MKNVKVKRFGDYRTDVTDDINDFIKDKEVIDIKQSMVMSDSPMEHIMVEYLVIYREDN